MFTAGGSRGLRRIATVLKRGIRLLDVGSVGYSASVPRATSALRKGTLLGTECVFSGCRLSYFTSSANLRIRTLNKTPNMCSTHCTNSTRGSRTGVGGLLGSVRNVRGHGTRFHAMFTLVVSKGRRLFRNVIGKRVAGGEGNTSNFNCSPVFVPRKCARAFTRVKGRLGGGVDRQTLTAGGLYGFLVEWYFWYTSVLVYRYTG